MLDRLDANIVKAADLYRQVGGFENELRGLAGHREAIRQRLEVAQGPDVIEVPLEVTTAEGEPTGEPVTVKMPAALYWRGVPGAYRDPERYTVGRTVSLTLTGTEPGVLIEVRDAQGALAWSH